MLRSTRCPKCDGSMSESVMIDLARYRRAIPTGPKGRAEKSIWTGDRCGFLESYAPSNAPTR